MAGQPIRNIDLFKKYNIPYREFAKDQIVIDTAKISYLVELVPIKNNPYVFKVFNMTGNRTTIESKDIANNVHDKSERVLKDANVLILDDNLHNRISLTGMITKWGMRPYAFSNAEEALHFTRLTNFDIGLINRLSKYQFLC